VGECVAGVAAVLPDQCRVPEVHAGVDAADDDALAAHTERRPHVVGADPVDAPLHRVHRLIHLTRCGLGDLIHVGWRQRGDLVVLGDAVRQLAGPAVDQDRVGDPEAGVVDSRFVQFLVQVGLARVGGGPEFAHHGGAALGPAGDGRGGRQVGPVGELDIEVGAVLLGQGCRQVGLDLCVGVRLGRRRRLGDRRKRREEQEQNQDQGCRHRSASGHEKPPLLHHGR